MTALGSPVRAVPRPVPALHPTGLAGLGMLRGRGPVCDALADHLGRWPHDFDPPPVDPDDPIGDLDVQTALFVCNELHYRGFPGVVDDWEWHPALVGLTAALEAAFASALRTAVPVTPTAPSAVPGALWDLARSGTGPSLSGWAREHGTQTHALELAVHRSAYQLKEADPHTFGMRSVTGPAKAAMVRIQHDEYGEGRFEAMHSTLWAESMTGMGLDPSYGAYLDRLPAATLATSNLLSLFAVHRRWRGALIGHLAGFEMNSVGPMQRYSEWMDRLGYGMGVRRFYDVHVAADEAHQHIAADELAAAYARYEPALAPSIMWGAQTLALVEQRFAAHVHGAWMAGRSSLLDPRPTGRAGRSADRPRQAATGVAATGGPHDPGER